MMMRPALRAVLVAAAVIAVALPSMAAVPVAKTVPWVATDTTVPHDTYSGKAITLKGTSDSQGSNIQFTWDFGDGSPAATGTVTNQYVVEATHVYSGAVGTAWIATLTLKNTTTGETSVPVSYRIAMRANALDSNVNVAIDEGLWYLHKNMRRAVINNLPAGDWTSGCPTDSGVQTVCHSAYGLTATNIQAFEVNGHLESGSANNPYTEDVARGLRSLFNFLTTTSISSHNITCLAGSCLLNPDQNGNGYGAYVNQSNAFYQGGMVIDAIVASGTPSAITTSGPAPSGSNPGILGRTYKDVVQDMVDEYAYCASTGSQGAGWRYNCQDFPDNSACQWGAIGIIGAVRGFGVTVNPNLFDANQRWLNYSNNTSTGEFGYTGTGPAWGPYAVTPSGMVQLAMDGIGRGDSRWDKAETYIRNNFGNAPTNSGVSIKAYYYGLFSFTKAMLLHSPGGVLTPLTLLQSQTPGVTPIDWYAAEVSKGDPTDGVARWLVSQQKAAGYWFNTQETNTAEQWPFSTGFAIIMLRRTVFVSCINNLNGRATASSVYSPARVGLVWGTQSGAASYLVLRGTAAGGPYSALGSTTATSFADTTVNDGVNYYYVVQPRNGLGNEICQSNEKKIFVP